MSAVFALRIVPVKDILLNHRLSCPAPLAVVAANRDARVVVFIHCIPDDVNLFSIFSAMLGCHFDSDITSIDSIVDDVDIFPAVDVYPAGSIRVPVSRVPVGRDVVDDIAGDDSVPNVIRSARRDALVPDQIDSDVIISADPVLFDGEASDVPVQDN